MLVKFCRYYMRVANSVVPVVDILCQAVCMVWVYLSLMPCLRFALTSLITSFSCLMIFFFLGKYMKKRTTTNNNKKRLGNPIMPFDFLVSMLESSFKISWGLLISSRLWIKLGNIFAFFFLFFFFSPSKGIKMTLDLFFFCELLS